MSDLKEDVPHRSNWQAPTLKVMVLWAHIQKIFSPMSNTTTLFEKN